MVQCQTRACVCRLGLTHGWWGGGVYWKRSHLQVLGKKKKKEYMHTNVDYIITVHLDTLTRSSLKLIVKVMFLLLVPKKHSISSTHLFYVCSSTATLQVSYSISVNILSNVYTPIRKHFSYIQFFTHFFQKCVPCLSDWTE